MMRRTLLHITVLGLIALAAGCSKQPDREAVSGTVMFRNQPLKWGTISFEPTNGDPMGGAGIDIVDGKFTIPKERGPSPGMYVVRISGGMNPADNPLEAGPRIDDTIPKGMVPAIHNEKSTMTREIKAGGPNDFMFDLK